MKINCTHCRKPIIIPDEKIPLEKAFSLNCPKCNKRFTVEPIKAADLQKPNGVSTPASLTTDGLGDVMDGGAPANPFQFLEEGAKTSMLCINNEALRSHVRTVVEGSGYHVLETSTPRDTLRQMRFHDFDLVVLDELFGTREPAMNHVLKYVGQLTMDSRRGMFVVLISDRFSTGDNMQAFHKSVNIIVNPTDINQFNILLKRGLGEHEAFYRIFNQEYVKINGI
jgi:predicted Zn finger-like uncharacterized protein